MAALGVSNNVTLDVYKKQHIKIAKDLGYGPRCIRQIENAKTEEEISNILCRARKEK